MEILGVEGGHTIIEIKIIMNRINSSLDIVEQLIKELENSIEKLTQNVALG